MAAFFRGFLLFAVGAAVGAATVFLFAPGFTVAVSRAPGNEPPLTLVNPSARSAPVAVVAPTRAPDVKPLAVVPAPAVPAAVVVAEPTKPVAEPTKPVVEPPKPVSTLDFKAISEHTIFWPNSVSVMTATKAALLDDGKKAGETELASGTVIQISKILPSGAIEGRARGVKLEVSSLQTNFEDVLRKRLAEMTEKGVKFTSPFLTEGAAPTTVAAAETPAAVPAATTPASATPAVASASAPVTLDDKVNVLFGRKDDRKGEKATPPATTPAPPAATPAVTPAAAAPSTAAMQAEKKEDLDRKVNQLFKKDAAK